MKKLYLILLSFLYINVSFGAPEYVFRTMSPDGGFYYDGVKSVKQDKEGFIWILMDNELYRFDGYQYISYYKNFQNIDNTKRWTFTSLETDNLGNLYILVQDKLFVKKPDSDKINLAQDSVRHVIVDKLNNTWIITENGLNKYNAIENTLIPIQSNNLYLKNIFRFWNIDEQVYAVSIWGSIHKVDIENNTSEFYGSLPMENYYFDVIYHNNKLWALTAENGLFLIDFDSIKLEKQYTFFKENNVAKTIYSDLYGNIWIGTHKGLYILDPETDTYQVYQHSPNNLFSIPDNSIWCINEDRYKNIWLGTYSGGLCYVNINERKHFKTYTPNTSLLNHHLVSGFAENDETTWISTEGGGINCIDKKSGEFSYLKHNNYVNSISSNNLKTLVYDSVRNNLWISTYRGGLDCYNPKNKIFKNFRNIPGDSTSLQFDNLRKIVMEADSGLWIIYQDMRIMVSYYSFGENTFKHIDIDNERNYIYDAISHNGKLYLITHNALYTLNISNLSLNKEPMPVNGQAIIADKENNLWIGTAGNGLIKYDLKDSSILTHNSLLINSTLSIHSIIADNEGNIWLGTDKGLYQLNLAEDAFMRYNKEDGIQGNAFYPLATMKGNNGDLFFGGTNGFTIISPSIFTNYTKPNAIITDVLIDNASAMFDTTSIIWNSSNKNDITLTYKQTNIGFKFSSDNYLAPSKSKYKFRLKDYDDRWVEVDAFNRNAYYTKLPAGKYQFELLAANNDGIWSETPTIININRLPAPWASPYAYVLYSLLIMFILYLIIRYYNKQKELKLALYKENLDKQQKEEIHQSQLVFFTNISHDFRTPLSLILATIQTLRKEGLKEYYYSILNNNANRLLNLVNELMLFRTIENGKMSLQLQEIDVNKEVTALAADFSSFAEQNHIDFQVLQDTKLPDNILIDKGIFEKIAVNLLNNAFKFTPEGGDIFIRIYSNVKNFVSPYKNSYTVGNTDTSNCFCIAVHDTGVGISTESISKIFERFYKVNTNEKNKHLGTGIGLALVKSLVLLHKGSITVYSERDKGTDIVVYFSKNKEIYNSDEILSQEEINNQQDNEPEVILESIPNTNDIYFREEKRILIVEDNDDLRHLVSDFLSSYYNIVEAGDGVSASEKLNNMEIDLIISDIMMPLKDGISFCTEVKTDINTSHIPFILLTAKTSVESKIEGADSGADIYLEKPVNFELLLTTVRNIFKHREQLKEYYSKNYFADVSELPYNQQNNKFLKQFVDLLGNNIAQSDFDVNFIASELSMSRSKLYSKIKSLTGKSIVEFVLSYRLRKAAQLIVEEDLTISEIMSIIGIESQSYFTRAFKKEFGETPTAFASKHKK